MNKFKLKTEVHQYDNFKQFNDKFNICSEDLIFTNNFIYNNFIKAYNLKCNFVFKGDFGNGEPSDETINKILNNIKDYKFNRLIAIGGGSIVDIAKLLTFKNVNDVNNVFDYDYELIKDKGLIVIPTTCGTGSEVTNISIMEVKSKNTKMGVARDELYPDHAVLIPELISKLPYDFFVYSSIDALIHAMESFVSPNCSEFTDIFATKSIEMIINSFLHIIENGKDRRNEVLKELLLASNFAGISFGNAGVGAVHALSYPLGGKCHVPHGESNYLFLIEVFKKYNLLKPNGKIKDLNDILAKTLNAELEDVYDKLNETLENMLSKNKLREYGMIEDEIVLFTDSVIKNQQRLLRNNYVELSKEDILDIYKTLY